MYGPFDDSVLSNFLTQLWGEGGHWKSKITLDVEKGTVSINHLQNKWRILYPILFSSSFQVHQVFSTADVCITSDPTFCPSSIKCCPFNFLVLVTMELLLLKKKKGSNVFSLYYCTHSNTLFLYYTVQQLVPVHWFDEMNGVPRMLIFSITPLGCFTVCITSLVCFRQVKIPVLATVQLKQSLQKS